MEKCKACKYSIFDEVWGEYKCEVTRLFVYDRDFECEDYKARGKKEEQKISKEEYRDA